MAISKKVQTFNDGVVKIYNSIDSASPGDMPGEALSLKETMRYHERTVGITRQSAAKQDNAEIKYVLRCPLRRNVSAQDVAIPNDGKQYKIWAVQIPEDIEPPAMDLTLQVMTAVYDIYQPAEEESDDEP